MTGSLCILCADDNLCFRYFVNRLLTDIGCHVAEAGTASEALSLVRKRPDDYDLLMIADCLPDMDGVELFQMLRSIPYTGRIVVTAPKLLPYRQAAYEALGASTILITPVGNADLLRILEPPRTAKNSERRPDQPGDGTCGRAPDSSFP